MTVSRSDPVLGARVPAEIADRVERQAQRADMSTSALIGAVLARFIDECGEPDDDRHER
jgi:hypothetical protein